MTDPQTLLERLEAAEGGDREEIPDGCPLCGALPCDQADDPRAGEMWAAIEIVIAADDEALARGHVGIADCWDNSGRPYQSAVLATALATLLRAKIAEGAK